MAYLTNLIFTICHALSLSVMYTVYYVINISLILTVCELLQNIFFVKVPCSRY